MLVEGSVGGERRIVCTKSLFVHCRGAVLALFTFRKGKRCNISEALALLIEQAYGYSAQWVLTGEGDCYISKSDAPGLSPTKKRVIAEIEKMSEPELDAVKVFIDSLDGYKKAFGLPDEN